MIFGPRRLFDDLGVSAWRKLGALFALLVVANLAAWGWGWSAFQGNTVLLGTAFLAYGLGLRHAVDADHIAAIDNVTRKLMQEGKRPIAVGFFFALGHSSVVIAASVAVALGAGSLQERYPELVEAGGTVGTMISALFLFAIALINIGVMIGVYRLFRRARSGGRYGDDELDRLLAARGPMGRVFRRLFRLVTRSWHMYPLGLLFGLGFDTATEIGLLGISASGAVKGMSLWTILVFPALFTAGMSLVDTADGVVMLGAYGWAFVKPIRKLYYNLSITGVSVVVAVLVGGIEMLGLLAERLGLHGGMWDAVGLGSDNFGLVGCGIIVIFAASWLVSLVVYRVKGYDKLGA